MTDNFFDDGHFLDIFMDEHTSKLAQTIILRDVVVRETMIGVVKRNSLIVPKTARFNKNVRRDHSWCRVGRKGGKLCSGLA